MQTCTYGLEEGNRKPVAVMSQGAGCLSYLEKCYHNALYYELKSTGLNISYGFPYIVKYRGEIVGEYFADLVVEGKVILELKSVKALGNEHISQLLNYLHISRCRLGYLLNFQHRRFEFKRFVHNA